MPLDASVYGIQRQPQMPDALENFLRLSAIKQSQQAQQFAAEDQAMQRAQNARAAEIGAMQIAQAKRQQKDQEVLGVVLSEVGGDFEKLPMAFLKAGGSPATFQKLQEDNLKRRKELAELDQKGLESRKLQNSQFLGVISNAEALPDDVYAASWPQIKQSALAINPNLQIPDQPVPKAQLGLLRMGIESDEQRIARETAQRLGTKAAQEEKLFPSQLAKSQNEALTSTPNASGLTAGQQATLDQQRAAQDRIAADAAASRALTARGQDITLRGQNMTDSRQRDLVEVTRETKPPTEAEAKSLGFYDRFKQANEVINSLDRDKINTLKLKLPDSANVLLNAEEQAYKQAERQMIEAYLRRDSGAVIGPSEYRSAKQALGLQFGDKESTIEQKRKARQTHMDALKSSAGRAFKQRYGEDPMKTEAKAADPLGIR